MSSNYAPPADVERSAFFIAFGAYLVFTLAIAYNQYAKSHGSNTQGAKTSAETHAEHFLGSKTISVVPLFLTLFSTIYSGYTLVGVVGMAAGPAAFISTMWLTSAPIVSLSSILLLPRLYALSRRRNYTGPTDLIMDRFDDRILQTLISLMLCAQGCLYLVTQFYTVKVLIPVLSGGAMNANVTAWVLAAVMWICEAIGGWHAITRTDAIQSAVMIISLIAVPCIAHNYYGGAANSVDFGCEELVTVNCTGPEFAGALCYGTANAGATRIGCAAEVGFSPMGVGYTSGYKTLNPAGTTWSRYFQPLTEYLTGQLPAGAGTPRANYYTDGNVAFNNVAFYMLGFNLLFFAFSLNPHWLQRTVAGATATGVKQANMAMNFASLIATLPGILAGIMVGAHLLPIRAKAEPYGVLLAEFMDKEGFVEFVAVLAAVSVFAAIMSTVDSAMHGITNTLSSDFVKNWFFVKHPTYDTPELTLFFSRAISFCFLFMACAIALYDEKLNDSEGQDIYAKLISWQNALLFQCVPSFYLALYQSKVKAGNHIFGIVAGFITVIAMTYYEELHYNFGTRYAIEKDVVPANGGPLGLLDNSDDYTDGSKTFYFAYAPGLWGGLMNLVITMSLNAVAAGDEKPWMPISINAFGGSQLLGADVETAMQNTTEPFRTRKGQAAMLSTFLLCNLCLPWWGDANDNCDLESISGPGAYGAGGWNGGNAYPDGVVGGPQSGKCEGPDMVNGLPHWVAVVLGCYIVAMFTNFAAWSTWQPDPIDDTAGALSDLKVDPGGAPGIPVLVSSV
jgi:Na+/proline symporter